MKRKRFLTILTMLGVAAAISGCGSVKAAETETGVQATALVVGAHDCSLPPNINSALFQDRVMAAIRSYGFVSVIVVDGKPEIVSANNYDIPEQYKAAAETKLEADAKAKACDLLMTLSAVKANDPEVDTLEALRLAVRSFGSAPKGAKRTIIVADTGLQTTGLLDFGNHLIDANPETIAELLDQKHAIPDFSDTEVIWQSLGQDVAAPQTELSPKQQGALREIWRAIIEKGGGAFIFAEAVPNPERENAGLPAVTPLDLGTEEPVRFAEDMLERMDFSEPCFIGEDQVCFFADSSEYVDSMRASTVMEPIAAYMNRHESFQLLLVGTTAGEEDNPYVRQLSKERAEAVRETLISLGVASDRIRVLGLGNADPWHIVGAGTSGEMAAQNRKVVLLDADSELGARLLREEGR